MQNTVFSVANNSRKLNAPIRKGSINVAVKCFVVWLYYKYKLKQLLLNSGDKEAPTPKSKPTWLLMITYSQFLMSYSKIYSKNVKRSMENGISSSIKHRLESDIIEKCKGLLLFSRGRNLAGTNGQIWQAY